MPGGAVHFTRPVTWDRGTYDAVDRFHREVMGGESSLATGQALESAVMVIVGRHGETAPRLAHAGKVSVARAREFLRAHWADNVTLDDLSRAALASKFHLARTFNEVVGVPPHEYQRQLRVSHARRMLAAGTGISATAYACGFADQAHLTRAFRRAVGITPGQYRVCAGVSAPPDAGTA